MTCHITLLTSATCNSLTKTLSGPDLKVQFFKVGKDFNVSQEPVCDLHRLESESTQTSIRGSLVHGVNGPVPRKKETFPATSRQWCIIDIDSLTWDGDIQDQQAMLTHTIQQLTIEFQSVDYWYHFSSSMGIKPGIRVHLWFWLERPCSDDEMKAWLSGCPEWPS